MLYSERTHNDRIEYPRSSNKKMSSVFLPQIPNVKINIFELPKRRNRNCIWKTAEYKKISGIINYESSNHETSTCFMLFCNELSQITAKRWASAIKERYNYIYFIFNSSDNIYLSLSFKYSIIQQLLMLDNMFILLAYI